MGIQEAIKEIEKLNDYADGYADTPGELSKYRVLEILRRNAEEYLKRECPIHSANLCCKECNLNNGCLYECPSKIQRFEMTCATCVDFFITDIQTRSASCNCDTTPVATTENGYCDEWKKKAVV